MQLVFVLEREERGATVALTKNLNRITARDCGMLRLRKGLRPDSAVVNPVVS